MIAYFASLVNYHKRKIKFLLVFFPGKYYNRLKTKIQEAL